MMNYKMELSAEKAGELALAFLLADLEVESDDQEWFTVLNSRLLDGGWYIAEIGIEGLPDKWAIQVYDTHECDPNYTFVSPVSRSDDHTDLSELPDSIAALLIAERDARN